MDHQAGFDLFRRCGAILNGHFQLSSGLHSGAYVQCAKLTEHPNEAERACRELASRMNGRNVSVVAGPAYGGILIAYELARHLKARAVFFERSDGFFELRRGFDIKEGTAVLVAEDVVTTGGSAAEVIEQVRARGASVVGVAAFVNRAGMNPFGVPFESLLSLDLPMWKPQECPLCTKGLTVTKPGSRPSGVNHA